MLIGAAVCVAAALAAGALMLVVLALSNARLPDSTRVLGLDLGGMTRTEAEDALSAADPVVAFEDGARSWPQSFSALGIRIDAKTTLENSEFNPALTVDFGAAQTALAGLSDVVNVPATVDAPGRALDVPVLLSRLQTNATDELADLRLELPMFETERLTPAESVLASYGGPTSTHVVEAGEELGLIAKRYNVSISDVAVLNGIDDPNLIYPGQSLTIPAPGEYAPTAAEAPPATSATRRSIVVSISNQRIYAYDNGVLVHSHLTSTGLPDTPTVLGDYQIYVKHTATDMSGPGYYLPGVPYTMYFYQGYAIHGTYWHNNFGRPMSHGCVNLPVTEAAWFFDFASVGTMVRVVA
ncbi:MAG TPA: L,D-transpeptidase family protein [Candidatus Limnocylindrales bacterium]|nr:L,D-transpeptidase family protein [Candidatus Limnocylindrales bacterium]